MSRPLLLDLFCGAGGCSMGYHRAGFDVVGVDISPRPRYPFTFIQADALDVLEVLLAGEEWFTDTEAGIGLSSLAAIHASPPCQDYSKAMRHLSSDYPRLIDPVREQLQASGIAWVIENVPGAPLPTQTDLFGAHGVELCGSMFDLSSHGLMVYRHRLFETSFPVTPPRGCDHRLPAFNPHTGPARELIFARFGRDDPERPWRDAMGIPWMGMYDGREAIPPAYTEYIGTQLLAHLTGAGCAA